MNAENSNGFHAPQEAARMLGEAIDYARQGESQAAVLAASRGRRVAAVLSSGGESAAPRAGRAR